MENVFVLASNRMIYPHFISRVITKEKEFIRLKTPDKSFLKGYKLLILYSKNLLWIERELISSVHNL